jgi:hypothetical protein
MFKPKKRGQLSPGKDIKIQLNSKGMVILLKIRYRKNQKRLWILFNEKQFTIDNYVQYLDTACELAKRDKVKVIEIVQNKKKNMINKLLD